MIQFLIFKINSVAPLLHNYSQHRSNRRNHKSKTKKRNGKHVKCRQKNIFECKILKENEI